MTHESKLDEAAHAVDRARKARQIAVAPEERNATWKDLRGAIENYNRALRQTMPDPARDA